MLKTKRTHIRNFQPADASALFDYRNDEYCSRYQRYDDTSIEYLSEFVKNFDSSTFLSTEEEQHYAVADISSDNIIGDISIFFSEKDNCFTLGITVSPPYQRQGYAYEVLDAVISGIFEKYPLVDIVALIEKENEKSIALFKKLGFILECYAESLKSLVFIKYGNMN